MGRGKVHSLVCARLFAAQTNGRPALSNTPLDAAPLVTVLVGGPRLPVSNYLTGGRAMAMEGWKFTSTSARGCLLPRRTVALPCRIRPSMRSCY